MHAPVPWIALAALAAMFVLPYLDARGLLDGPRTVRHRPRREVCADCAEPWQPGHQCAGWLEAAEREPVVPLHPTERTAHPVRGELTRTDRLGRPAVPQRERRP